MDGTTGTTGSHGFSISKPVANAACADSFWKFCLQHYNKPEVQQACFRLQDDFKGNVNLALLLAWLESAHYSLSPNGLTALKQSMHQTEPLLRRYRLMRREIKPQLSKGAYQKMLNFELVLEKVQQQNLIATLNLQTWLNGQDSTLERYCRRLNPEAESLYPDLISRLLDAPAINEEAPVTPSAEQEQTECQQPATPESDVSINTMTADTLVAEDGSQPHLDTDASSPSFHAVEEESLETNSRLKQKGV